jgi:hypothetical protein
MITVGEHQVQEAIRMHSLQVVFEVHTFCAFAAKQTDKKTQRKIVALNLIVLYEMSHRLRAFWRAEEQLFTLHTVFFSQIRLKRK